MEYCNNFYSLAIVKSLTKLYNKHNKRYSKAYCFASVSVFFLNQKPLYSQYSGFLILTFSYYLEKGQQFV